MKSENNKGDILRRLIDILKNDLDKIKVNATTVWANTGWSLEEYPRSSFEIYYVIDGDVNLKIRGKTSIFHKGEVFFIDNSMANSCEVGVFTIFGLNFSVEDPDNLNRFFYESIRNVYQSLTDISYLTHKDVMKEYYSEIANEYIIRQTGYEMNIKFNLMLMLVKVLRALESGIKGDAPYRYWKYSELVSDIIAFLSENLHRPVTLGELGEKYHLNPRYLNRIFKGLVGYPVIQYQLQLKVEKAKRLLVTSSMNLLEIAFELNFGSSQYFNFIFRKVTGMTPGEYRRKARY